MNTKATMARLLPFDIGVALMEQTITGFDWPSVSSLGDMRQRFLRNPGIVHGNSPHLEYFYFYVGRGAGMGAN